MNGSQTLTAAVLKPVLKTLMALHFKPVKTNMNNKKMLIIFISFISHSSVVQ